MSETETETGTAGTASNPLAAMDAGMAANPQPTFKLLRDEMPVLSIDMGSSPGVLLSRKEEIDLRPASSPRSSPPTWMPSTSRTSGR